MLNPMGWALIFPGIWRSLSALLNICNEPPWGSLFYLPVSGSSHSKEGCWPRTPAVFKPPFSSIYTYFSVFFSPPKSAWSWLQRLRTVNNLKRSQTRRSRIRINTQQLGCVFIHTQHIWRWTSSHGCQFSWYPAGPDGAAFSPNTWKALVSPIRAI